MSESKKKKAGQQANKASDTTHAATLGDRLQAQLETLRAALPATTGAQEFARKQLSERDVMGLVFAAQTDSSIEISWDELDVVGLSYSIREP